MTFETLWAAYPVEHSPCRLASGDAAFENQCAIRVGVALRNAGFDMQSFGGAHCWHGHAPRHILRGEELAAWMRGRPDPLGEPAIFRNADANSFLGKRGVMFCRNFWGPGNQGDHIDLWNRDRMQTGDASYILRSEEVWFWDFDKTAQTQV